MQSVVARVHGRCRLVSIIALALGWLLATIAPVRSETVVRAWGGSAGWSGWTTEGVGWSLTPRQRDGNPTARYAHPESGEMTVGAYRSPIFRLRGDKIRFRMNGWDKRGDDPDAGGFFLRLAGDKSIVRSAAPPQQNGFTEQEWFVRDLKGREVYLEASDRLSEPGYAWIGLASAEEISLPAPTQARGLMALSIPSAGMGSWAVLTHDAIGRPTTPYLSSLGCGEAGTGTIESPSFAITGSSIRMAARGWDGRYGDLGRNRIELIDQATGEVLRATRPPLSDLPQRIEWRVEDLQGRRVFLRLVDGDGEKTFAWMGVDEVDAGPAFHTKFTSSVSLNGWRAHIRPPMPVEQFGTPFLCYPSSVTPDGGSLRVDLGIKLRRLLLLGMNPPDRWVLVGDSLGSIVVKYADGVTERYPLIIGESIWWGRRFAKYPEPFVSYPKARAAFRASIRLYPAGPVDNGLYIAAIKPRNAVISSIEVVGSVKTHGSPEIHGLTVEVAPGQIVPGGVTMPCGRIPADLTAFMEHRTLRREGTGDRQASRSIAAIRNIMYNTEANFPRSFPLEMPKGYRGPEVRFEGDLYAAMLTNVFHHNLHDMASKVDEKGLYHTSSKGAPWYGYDGFGTFTIKGQETGVRGAGFYYDEAWTRDMGRSLGELVALGYLDKAKRCADYSMRAAHVWEDGSADYLLLNGQRLPRHICRVLQFPNTAVGCGAFENDGHGLTSLFIHNLWKRLPDRDAWLRPRWSDVRGLGDWVVWQLAHPEISKATDVLWSDSEGSGWDAGTGSSVYCDVACIEALYGLAEMADSIGEKVDADRWRETASKLRAGGESNYLMDDPKFGRTWTMRNAGWGGQSVLGPLIISTDMSGFSPDEDALGWRAYDKASYERNRVSVVPGAMGYGYAFSTQAALLLDRMRDASHLLDLTCRAIYNPMRSPYIVPESSLSGGDDHTFVRMGDLGNGVQQAETVKTLRVIVGIDDSHPSELRVLPRMPFEWSGITARSFPAVIERSGARETVHVSYTLSRTGGGMRLHLVSDKPLNGARVRLGAFRTRPTGTGCTLDGRGLPVTVTKNGDSWWVSFTVPEGHREFEAVVR